jgi:hypothetical protein
VNSAQLLPIVRKLFSESQEYLQYLHRDPKELVHVLFSFTHRSHTNHTPITHPASAERCGEGSGPQLRPHPSSYVRFA